MAGDSISFPIHTLHVNPLECAFADADKTKDNLPVASVDMAHQLVSVIDHRAHALGVQGKFEAAVKVAQQIIVNMPTLATGYLRIANLYRMQGKQRRAIDAYEAGLRCVSPDDPRYLQLMDGMAGAKQQAEKQIDFVRSLPIEIVEDIITLLSTEYRLLCLRVSKTWRKKVLECARAWRTCSDSEITDAGMITRVASHIRILTIGTENEQVWGEYQRSIMEGCFARIKSFHLTARTAKLLASPEQIDSTIAALSRMDSTLTKLELDLSGTQNTTLTLSRVLLACTRLKSLICTSTSRLADWIGNISLLDEHRELVDMKLDSKSIAGKDILPLLQKCQHIRRLVLDGCNTTVLHAIDLGCPRLEILGYNTGSNPVSELTKQRPTLGLREFYTKNGGDPEFAAIILPLIRKNMATLETLYMNISGWGLHELSSTYADLKLENVDKLTFWGDDSGIIQPLILRSISSCTTLAHLSVSVSHDIPGLVDALITLPRLETLELSHIWSSVGCTYLVRLFDAYAQDTRDVRPFRTISLGCCYVITDAVLAALSKIRSLENISLSNLRNVSTSGIDAFLKGLSKHGPESISLIEINSVMDNQIIALGQVKGLRNICLDELKNVTDRGIMKMVDEAPLLRKLTVARCNSVTLNSIAHAKQKIKAVVTE